MGTFFLDILSEVADWPIGKYLHSSKFEGCRRKKSSVCTEYERTILPGLQERVTYALVAVCQSECKGSFISESSSNNCMLVI